MPHLPFLEVEDLSASLSFYSAILEPLGLRHISTERGHFPSVTFGSSVRDPVFQLHRVVPSRDRPLRCSRIVVTAPSAAATDEAFELALQANPDLRDTSYLRHPAEAYPTASGAPARRTTTHGGGTRVVITDLDLNTMAIVYQPPFEYPPQYNSPTVRRTRSTDKEASRILTWNFDAAGSSRPAPAGASSAYSGPPRADPRRSLGYHPDYDYEEEEEADFDEDNDDTQRSATPRTGPKRSVTTGTPSYERAASARENSTGLSAGAVAGAALAYNMVRGDRNWASAHEDYEVPPFNRRSTFPDKYDPYSDRKGRYQDTERSADKARYFDDYSPAFDHRRPQPDFVARYSHVDPPRARDVDGAYDDQRGRHSIPRSRPPARPRSEAATNREPYLHGDSEYRGYVGSKGPVHPPIVQRGYTYDGPERDSYAFPRSQRSSNTVRAPQADPYLPSSHPISLPRSGSRVTTTTYKVSGSPHGYSREDSYSSGRQLLSDSRTRTYMSTRDLPPLSGRAPAYLSSREASFPSDGRAGTYYSTRHVSLPRGGGGSSRARYEDDDDDDADSIAPSDSISCVGSRRSR